MTQINTSSSVLDEALQYALQYSIYDFTLIMSAIWFVSYGHAPTNEKEFMAYGMFCLVKILTWVGAQYQTWCLDEE